LQGLASAVISAQQRKQDVDNPRCDLPAQLAGFRIAARVFAQPIACGDRGTCDQRSNPERRERKADKAGFCGSGLASTE